VTIYVNTNEYIYKYTNKSAIEWRSIIDIMAYIWEDAFVLEQKDQINKNIYVEKIKLK